MKKLLALLLLLPTLTLGQPVSSRGYVSARNSSTATLGNGGVFTGDWEEIRDYAMITVQVFADQASANDGLAFEWSSNASNADVSEGSSVLASTGRAFALTPRARYFRVKYTNGSSAQGAFRLQTVYHENGTGLISRPLDKTLSDENFGETVRAVIGVGTASDHTNLTTDVATNYLPVRLTDGSAFYTASGGGGGSSDTELPAAAALTDNTANPTAPAVGAFLQAWDGSGWDRVQTGAASGGALKVDGSAVTQPVSGTVTANAGSGTFLVGDGAGPLTVDGTVAATQSGSWTVTANAGTNLNTSALALDATTGRAQGSSTSGQTGPLVQGAVTTAAPSYTTAQTSPLSLTTAGGLRIDGSGTTQPVSGTVTANAGSGTFLVGDGSGALTVDGTVAATQSGAWNVGVTSSVAPAGLTTLTTGQQAVTSSAAVLPTVPARYVCIRVLSAGSQTVYFGPSGVTTSTGMELLPGDGWCAALDNLNRIFVVAGSPGSTVAYETRN